MRALRFAVAVAPLVLGVTTLASAEDVSKLKLVTTMPALGEATTTSDNQQTIDLNPIGEGASFDDLGKVLKEFAQSPANRRGAQEIAIYRQAAPAVALLKTKEG